MIIDIPKVKCSIEIGLLGLFSRTRQPALLSLNMTALGSRKVYLQGYLQKKAKLL